MATLSITISDPTLGVGESFRERHRLLPAGAWSSYVTRTNTTFNITGLTEGRYEFEIAFVQADATICPATTRYYDVVEPSDPDPFACANFVVTQVLSPERIRIAYTGASVTPPPCGYIVEYRPSSGGSFSTVTYLTLPATPFYINIPLSGRDLQVRITANLCNGSLVCFDSIIPAPPQPVCNHLGTLSYDIVPIEGTFQNKKKFRITITAASQSTIPTNSVTVKALQTSVRSPATPWSASIPITGISSSLFTISFTLEYNIPAIGTTSFYYWDVSFVDACGFNHFLPVQYP